MLGTARKRTLVALCPPHPAAILPSPPDTPQARQALPLHFHRGNQVLGGDSGPIWPRMLPAVPRSAWALSCRAEVKDASMGVGWSAGPGFLLQTLQGGALTRPHMLGGPAFWRGQMSALPGKAALGDRGSSHIHACHGLKQPGS